MFTGIIQELGTVACVERAKGVARLTIQAPQTASRVQRAESVSVHGACLSVVNVHHGALVFELIPETQRMTALGRLRAGSRVNLERSLRVCDPLSGHLVFGHVDGVGTVISRRALQGELVLGIRVGASLRRFLVPKGPVAVDGVSLTVGQRPGRAAFTIHLIPETLRLTTLGSLAVGQQVNLEIDYFAKLIWQFLNRRSGVLC